MPLQPNEYQCTMCKQFYTKGISDEEAMAETQSYWPGVPAENCDVVCDDCWQKIHPETHPAKYQDSLIESTEQTYRAACTDPATDEILPVDVALKSLIKQVCATFDVPEAALYTDDPVEWARILTDGELINVNRMSHETEERVYRRQFFKE